MGHKACMISRAGNDAYFTVNTQHCISWHLIVILITSTPSLLTIDCTSCDTSSIFFYYNPLSKMNLQWETSQNILIVSSQETKSTLDCESIQYVDSLPLSSADPVLHKLWLPVPGPLPLMGWEDRRPGKPADFGGNRTSDNGHLQQPHSGHWPIGDQAICVDHRVPPRAGGHRCHCLPSVYRPGCFFQVRHSSNTLRTLELYPNRLYSIRIGRMVKFAQGLGQAICHYFAFNFKHMCCCHTLSHYWVPNRCVMCLCYSEELVFKMSEAISYELRAHWNYNRARGVYLCKYGLSCFSPVINIMRHPLWGRNQVS